MTAEQIRIESAKYNNNLSKHPMSVSDLTDVLVGFYEHMEKLQKNDVSGVLPLTLKSVKKLKRGDVFLWRSGMTERYEIHTFHSDSGYGVKTFTDYNEKDGSSMLVNWSGVCGVLVGNDR